MWAALDADIADAGLCWSLRGRQGLLSPCAVVLPCHEIERVERAVWALHSVFMTSSLVEAALEIARGDGLPDHVTPDGPRLIEINTNPGGMLAVAA